MMTWLKERMLLVMFTFPWLRLIHHHVDGHLSKSHSASQSIYLPSVWIDLCAGHVGGASEPSFDAFCYSSRTYQNGLRALKIDNSDSEKGTERTDRQTDRQTDRWTNRQTDGQTNRKHLIRLSDSIESQ